MPNERRAGEHGSPRPTAPLALLLAVALPVALLGVTAQRLGVFDAAPEPVAAVGDDALKASLEAEPEVLVVSNSQGGFGLDQDALQAALGADVPLAVLTRAGMAAPTAYAVLESGVFGAGHRPRVVLLLMSLHHLLATEPPADNLQSLFASLGGPDDPVIRSKVLGESVGPLPGLAAAVGRLRARKDASLLELTSLPMALLGDPDPLQRMKEARERVLPTVDAQNFAPTARMIPVVEPASSDARPQAGNAEGIEASLLPDMVDVIEAHDARLVVATLPQRTRGWSSSPGSVAQLEAYLASRDAGFVHLEGLAIPDNGWVDRSHMNEVGAQVYTAALVDALRDIGAFSGAPLERSDTVVAPPTVTRGGSLPDGPLLGARLDADPEAPCLVRVVASKERALSDRVLRDRGLGDISPLVATLDGQPLSPHQRVRPTDGCAGTMEHAPGFVLASAPHEQAASADPVFGWDPALVDPTPSRLGERDTPLWVPPGAHVALAWPEAPTSAGAEVMVTLVEGTSAREAGAAPRVSLGEVAVTATRMGRLWRARLPVPPPGPWDLRVEVPSQGPWVLLAQVRVDASDQGSSIWLVGHPQQHLTRIDLAGGEGNDVTEPDTVPELDVPGVVQPPFVLFDLPPELRALDAEALQAATGSATMATRCTPFEGQRTASDGVQAVRLPRLVDGRFRVRQRPEDATDWRLVHKQARRCGAGGVTWVYPGDTIAFDRASAASLHVPADQLELIWSAFPAGAHGTAEVTLSVDGQVVLTEQVPFADAPTQRATLRLPVAVGPDPGPIRLSVTVPEGGPYVLVGAASLFAAPEPGAP